jgi:hypothetical protein
MLKALSLAAALAVLPLSSAVADPQTPSEAALEEATTKFEARMEAFGERAEAIDEDDSLTKEQKSMRIAALWTEYSPDVQAFTALVSRHAAEIADEALAQVDVDAIVTEALAAVNVSGAMAAAGGIASNGAWASNDPEHMETYGLVAQYAVGEALDAADGAQAEIDEAAQDAAEAAAEALEASSETPGAEPASDPA